MNTSFRGPLVNPAIFCYSLTMTFTRITIDPAVCTGKPCIRGLRFPVARLLGLLAAGESRDEILKNYPYLEGDDIDEALRYAAQLAEFTGIRVKEAEANEPVQPGTLYICPGGHHLRVTPTGRIQLDGSSGRVNGYLPNIDVTMESVAAYAGAMSIGAILTGMGNDGTRGAKAIKAAGGLVLAQDEATCVIFGMPAEAIKTGAVDQVLGIDDVYPAIEKRVIGICRTTPVGVR